MRGWLASLRSAAADAARAMFGLTCCADYTRRARGRRRLDSMRSSLDAQRISGHSPVRRCGPQRAGPASDERPTIHPPVRSPAPVHRATSASPPKKPSPRATRSTCSASCWPTATTIRASAACGASISTAPATRHASSSSACRTWAEPHRRHGRQRHRHAGAVAHLARRAGVRRRHRQCAGARSSNDELADAIRKYPDALRRAGRRRAAGPDSRREGNRARRAQARPQGRDHELAHHGRVARRPEVLGHLRGRRSARRADLPASELAAARHDRSPTSKTASTARCSASRPRPACTCCASSWRACSIEFPKLKIVIGHCGEALPFWLYRIDYMHGATARRSATRT